MKKTIPVATLLKMYNNACRVRPELYVMNQDIAPEVVIAEHNETLKGMTQLITTVLHLTGNYKGYVYIGRDGKLIGLDNPEFCEYRREYIGFNEVGEVK